MKYYTFGLSKRNTICAFSEVTWDVYKVDIPLTISSQSVAEKIGHQDSGRSVLLLYRWNGVVQKWNSETRV